MNFNSAVLHKPGEELSIETVQLKGLDATEVLIPVKPSGQCHTDLEIIDGKLNWPFPVFWDTKAPEKLLRSVLK